MFTLDNFYTSPQWIKLTRTLKLERTDKNGDLICEYCHRPIVKAYDCIAHHKVELTNENVNDLSVSLNPDNIMLIHFGCHNKIHERFSVISNRVYLVYGPPCAGKTTWVNEHAEPDDLIIDIRRIWKAVCNSDERPNRVKRVVFNIRDALLEQVKMRTGMWRHAFVVGGYPFSTERKRLCDLLGAVPIFIDTPKEECIARANDEQTTSYIDDWFDDYNE